MIPQQALFDYVLRLGDSSLILGQRLSAWCAHAPTLEQDVAMVNIALDLIGQARSLLTYAGAIEGQGRSEDDLAYLRDSRDWRNVLLVEQSNGDFAKTLARQFLYDTFSCVFYTGLARSEDRTLAAVAAKAIKEVTYHRRHSSHWMIRLGDGTEESHMRMQNAVNELWIYTGELFHMDQIDRQLLEAGIAVDLDLLRPLWDDTVNRVFTEATLQRPEDSWMREGGKQGLHSEQLGYLLAEMQYLQRAYPGARW
jgi:ring-1,2-phenylacetyl-CoA epoxidase subunit PaaC